jgi:hypothetical protein
MKKLLIATLIALAVPAAASAHFGWHHHALLAKLSGTGTLASSSGSMTSNKLGNGTFTGSVTTTGAAVTHTGDRGTVSCAPASATLTLTGTSTSTSTLTGKECTWTPAGTTTAAGSMFFGRNSTTKAFLVAKSDGTVHGAVFAGMDRETFALFAAREHDASRQTGDCDGH